MEPHSRLRLRSDVLLVAWCILVIIGLGFASSSFARGSADDSGVVVTQVGSPAYDGYQGWGAVAGTSSGRDLARDARSVVAWEWHARVGWRLRDRRFGDRVYIYPYAAGWSWTWTPGDGWLAMRTSALVI